MDLPNSAAILAGLKDFQRDTVEYVFRRLYLDDDCTHRFLVADEVGLGKTLVGRGLIAKTLEHLWKPVERIDIVYICSNLEIARQNIRRLNVTGQDKFALASRITLLPLITRDLNRNKVNFISFTPGTSFSMGESTGWAKERVLLYEMLRTAWRLYDDRYINFFQCGSYVEGFRYEYERFERTDRKHIDKALKKTFLDALDARIEADLRSGEIDIKARLRSSARRFKVAQNRYEWDAGQIRNRIIGELRTILARVCLEALQPDLVILDEFQRFPNLLKGEDEAGRLAQELFSYANDDDHVRVLLLSATPYRMLTLSDEEGSDHYSDFVATVGFLLNDEAKTDTLAEAVRRYRSDLLRWDDAADTGEDGGRADLERILRSVVVRTERLAVKADRNGMLEERRPAQDLRAADVCDFAALQQVGRLAEQPNVIDYWKSAPYLLSFMDDYKLKSEVRAVAADPLRRDALAELMRRNDRLELDRDTIGNYQVLDPGNSRLRTLIDDTVTAGAWRLLWLPPSLPYYQADKGAYADSNLQSFTKRLVFSSWTVVPKTIAALVSYEAQRRMATSQNPEAINEEKSHSRQPLRFERRGERGGVQGMSLMSLLLPSVTLADLGDPLTAAAEHAAGSQGEMTRLKHVSAVVKSRIEPRLLQLTRKSPADGPVDERWYWAGPLLIGAPSQRQQVVSWLQSDPAGQLATDDATVKAEGIAILRAAFNDVVEVVADASVLGRPPRDLLDAMVDQAVASPGICALRAFRTVTADTAIPDAMTAALRVAWGFRVLFNHSEVIDVVRSEQQHLRGRRGSRKDKVYWRQILRYAAMANLQAVLDEFVHVLHESRNLVERTDAEAVLDLSQAIVSALTVRSAPVSADTGCSLETTGECDGDRRIWFSTRFAARFGDSKAEGGEEGSRMERVRAAFNSPFWPFVLASTSVGQEGLDFHTYCHAVVHWNLPHNPVDLEQREGRVHRYKGHAVRKNIARHHGTEVLSRLPAPSGRGRVAASPWQALFSAATDAEDETWRDLVPFWVYPGSGATADDARIERCILVSPLSRDADHLERLKSDLAAYRMVFGQPRQDDLLEYLKGRFSSEQIEAMSAAMAIDLSPPQFDS